MLISIVLPTYNEADSIGSTLKKLRAANLPDPLEIIVCDDHSPDKTLDAVRAADPDAVPLIHEGPRGLSASVVYGFEHAKGDILVCMDADGQHRAEDLSAVIEASKTAGFSVGSRFVPGGGFQERWSPFRLSVSRTSALLAKIFLGTPLHDPMSGFFALKREIFLAIRPHLNSAGFKIMLESAAIASALDPMLKIQEVPIRFALRKAGASKASAKIALQYFAMLLACRKTCKDLLNRTGGK